jgi:predicted dehydrogenase
MSLVKDPNNIRVAMLGMVDGNGHPYSWSAIINGDFDDQEMAKCPYAGIPQYLTPGRSLLGIPGVKVTHVWCDDPGDSVKVSKASLVANVVQRPEDVIGKVDAVFVATDIGYEHVERCRPFIEAGIPVFIDKPMVDSEDHLQQFVRWQKEGRPLMSSSAMRYAREYVDLSKRLPEVGDLRLIYTTMCKTWERYGIHAMEGVYPLLKPGGWESITHSGTRDHSVYHIHHNSGVEVVVPIIVDMYGGFGFTSVHGTKGSISASFGDTLYAFKTQLEGFVQYLRTGKLPFAFDETIELMKIIIAGLRSREQGGKKVMLSEIRA